jgi:AraC-like DNA-binding protein
MTLKLPCRTRSDPRRGLPIVVCPGTTKGWVNPSPVQTPRQLVIHGGFVVDDSRARQLERRAQRLGFADLRGYVQARSNAGHSIPRLAAELEVSEWTVKRALRRVGVTLLPRAERLARQRRHATQQRLTARAAKLGFADLGAYLADRLLVRMWPLVEVTAELGTHRATVRRLMDQHGIRRERRTPQELAAGERGRRAQAAAWQARRAERLAELGFQDLVGYLQRRYVEQGWSVRRMRTELGVGRRWLAAEMARLGLRR